MSSYHSSKRGSGEFNLDSQGRTSIMMNRNSFEDSNSGSVVPLETFNDSSREQVKEEIRPPPSPPQETIPDDDKPPAYM